MSNNDNFIKQYNNEIYAKTKKYQKIYGFEIVRGITNTCFRKYTYYLDLVNIKHCVNEKEYKN